MQISIRENNIVSMDDDVGSTVIWHDCVDSCWQQPVFYNVTARQVMSLIQQSGDCVQSLELPLECASSHRFSQTEAIGHSNTSVWLDRHGQRHTFADYCLNPKSSGTRHFSAGLSVCHSWVHDVWR